MALKNQFQMLQCPKLLRMSRFKTRTKIEWPAPV